MNTSKPGSGRLDQRHAVLTGAGGGIGAAVAAAYLREGACCTLVDLSPTPSAEVDELAAQYPERMHYLSADITKEENRNRIVDEATKRLGPIDILFNNAGISDRMTSIAEITAEGWSWIFDVLVRGPALGMKHAVPLMLERGGGSIVNTASIAGLQAGFGPIAYSTAKAGVIHMSRVAAAQLSPQKIRVNAICPGWIETGPWQKASRRRVPHHREVDRAQHPVGRVGEPADIAALAAFLAGPQSGFITGAQIVVDGGMTRKMIYEA